MLVAFYVFLAVALTYAGAASLFTRQRVNLNRIERKLDTLLQHHGIELHSKLSPEVQRLSAAPHQTIAAIKLHREQTGLGLAEAKAEIEAFQSGHLPAFNRDAHRAAAARCTSVAELASFGAATRLT